MNYTYKTHNVCASQINFDIDGDIISNIQNKKVISQFQKALFL